MDSEIELIIQPDNFIDVTHYESIRFSARIENTTAGTLVKDEHLIQVVQILEMGFVLEVPKNSCAVGHHLSMEIYINQPGNSPLYMNTTNRVIAMENIFEDRDRIEIKLIQFSEETWQEVRDLLEKRQNEIEKFIYLAKGHA